MAFNGKVYSFTRLGFGLNCVPKIMSKNLGTVLPQNEGIHRATDDYINDVIVDESIVLVAAVASFGSIWAGNKRT